MSNSLLIRFNSEQAKKVKFAHHWRGNWASCLFIRALYKVSQTLPVHLLFTSLTAVSRNTRVLAETGCSFIRVLIPGCLVLSRSGREGGVYKSLVAFRPQRVVETTRAPCSPARDGHRHKHDNRPSITLPLPTVLAGLNSIRQKSHCQGRPSGEPPT